MNTPALIKVWDLPLRIFHWLLVLGFAVAYLTEDDLLDLHVWAGYLVFGLLLFRLVWGFIGNPYARFGNFLCRPVTSFNYLKDIIALKAKRYLGHNPAGAAMIVLLLLSLLMTTLTGFAVYGADQAAGPLASIGPAHEKFWEEIHELFANLSVVLVLGHIAGVAVESFLHKENLARAMVHGNKKPLDE
ncbi:MAG: cytochrome b/b6 domain-containing protein [Methylovulum sp.]|uniref:cytochrome b/b6 domain-containing protein n=1 Tax=Methylovulum sp. TaxID=1916980 RepID=UPI00261F797E|nr:cytochrome b/b6 domain-containing protein [Methylovulum sp.]MDD2725185.1 cytochrome b/b6 domain-containing protein [Methylovulum sp.]MDD5124382.1 cytochrome b/b6 domain-containing protein [Methylovulum sp.]